MPEFLTLLPPQAARAYWLKHIAAVKKPLAIESVPTTQAMGRIVATPIIAPYPMPSFTRSAMDCYAVRAVDTYGASEGLPAYLHLVGEVKMGETPACDVETAECVLIHTGGMLPRGADAVVMLENSQLVLSAEVEVFRPVAMGENVIFKGEDVQEAELVIQAGAPLRTVEIGGLMAFGMLSVPVYRRPVVGILSTGDEVVPPQAEILPGQVRDINTYTLSALVSKHGGEARSFGILSDKIEVVYQAALTAWQECDLVAITAGSSASARDLTAEVIQRLGEPGVLVHGINLRPGKPTILALCNGKPVIGLPGNPISALVVAGLFLVPAIQTLLGVNKELPKPYVQARLTTNLASQAGREEWVAVRLLASPEGYLAEPVFGKSNLIFTLTRADGLICIPPEVTGLNAGELVEVVYL